MVLDRRSDAVQWTIATFVLQTSELTCVFEQPGVIEGVRLQCIISIDHVA